MNKIGIEKLKMAILVGIALLMHGAEALVDKKITLAEAFGFIPELMKVPEIVNNIGAIKEELQDLDAAERSEINIYFAEKFDIANDQIEAVVEGGVNVIMTLLEEVDRVQKLKAA